MAEQSNCIYDINVGMSTFRILVKIIHTVARHKDNPE